MTADTDLPPGNDSMEDAKGVSVAEQEVFSAADDKRLLHRIDLWSVKSSLASLVPAVIDMRIGYVL
jgi:hypothetical protein